MRIAVNTDNLQQAPYEDLLHDAALDYVQKGYWVYPVTIRLKDNGKKLPTFHVEWGTASSNDPAQIDRWFGPSGTFRGSGIGIDCDKSGIAVVDLDGPDGLIGWSALIDEHGNIATTMVNTRSGGSHLYYRQRDDAKIFNTASRVQKGIDVRGARDTSGKAGGTVFAPPTRVIGIDGQAYSFGGPLLAVKDLPLTPEWLPPMALKKSQERQQTAFRPFTPPVPQQAPQRTLRDRLAFLAQQIAECEEGTGETTINDAGFEMSHFIASGEITYDEVYETFRAAVETHWTSGVHEAHALVSKSLRDHQNVEPRYWDGDGQEERREWNEYGLAERLVDRHGTTIRWITDTRQWMVYDGKRWSLKSAESLVFTKARDTIKNLEEEAEQYDSERPDEDTPSERERFLAWAGKQKCLRATENMVKLARGEEDVHEEMDAFDTQPYLLNLDNGVLDLETGLLQPHAPHLNLTHYSRVSYDPTATAPKWEAFLERVMPDPARRDYLARIVGYSLTGSISEHALFIHHGNGANGKSVFLKVVMALLGDYTQAVPPSTLMTKKNDGGIPNDIARMMGKRMLSVSETEAGKKLDEQMVKQLTAGDTVTARFLRAEFFDFTPTAKIHMATNFMPHVSGGHAIARRLHAIGWEVTIPEHEQDAELPNTIIREELAGVLNWAIRGYQQWRLMSLAMPDAVRQKTTEHVKSGDLVGRWIDECVSQEDGKDEEQGILYGAYKSWCEQQGEKAMAGRSFTQALKEHGLENALDSRTRRSIFKNVKVSRFVAR